MIAIGTDAPDFELSSNELTPEGRPGKKIRLSDFRGKKHVVLAFYPLDFSPTCSTEHACFKDDSLKLDGADFHPKGEIAAKFGLYNADRGMTKRATVIIDKAGKVVFTQEHEGQRDDQVILSELAKLG
jgi:peroxiredoxin